MLCVCRDLGSVGRGGQNEKETAKHIRSGTQMLILTTNLVTKQCACNPLTNCKVISTLIWTLEDLVPSRARFFTELHNLAHIIIQSLPKR